MRQLIIGLILVNLVCKATDKLIEKPLDEQVVLKVENISLKLELLQQQANGLVAEREKIRVAECAKPPAIPLAVCQINLEKKLIIQIEEKK